MRLTDEQIRSVTAGALRVERREDGLHFYKCTEKQTEAWSALSSGLGQRSLTTTGIRLDFHTDSRHLSFVAPSGNKFEVYVDNVLRAQFDCEALSREEKPAELDLTDALGGETEQVRVTLIFPSHGVGVLDYVELDDGSAVTPHKFDRKILFMGDSITQGWDTVYDSLSYAWRVTRFFNAESVIQGVGGAYFHETLVDVSDFDPDTVVIAFGTNDFGHYHTQEELRAHTSAFLRAIVRAYGDKKIYVISPIWREAKQKTMGTFREARAVIVEEIEKLGLCHIDGLSLVPPMPVFFKDATLHPDDLGFSLYAENLIRQMLER